MRERHIHYLLATCLLTLPMSASAANICHELGASKRPAEEILGEHPWSPSSRSVFVSQIDQKLQDIVDAQTDGNDAAEYAAEQDLQSFVISELVKDLKKIGSVDTHASFISLINELTTKGILLQHLPIVEELNWAYEALTQRLIHVHVNLLGLDLQRLECSEIDVKEPMETLAVLFELPFSVGELPNWYLEQLETFANKCPLQGWLELEVQYGPLEGRFHPYAYHWDLEKEVESRGYFRGDSETVDPDGTIYGAWYFDNLGDVRSRIRISKDLSAKLIFNLVSKSEGATFFGVGCDSPDALPPGRLDADVLGAPGTGCVVFAELADGIVVPFFMEGVPVLVPPIVAGPDSESDINVEFSCSEQPIFLDMTPTPNEPPEGIEYSVDYELHFGTPPIE